MTMQRLSEHILALANNNSLEVTNLQLQKVMFFTLGLHLRRQGEIDRLARSIYDQPFERWKYGPVVEDIYFDYNHFGRRPIEDNVQSHDIFESLDGIIFSLIKNDVFKLVNASHEMPSWSKYREQILNGEYVPPYKIEEILEDFTNE